MSYLFWNIKNGQKEVVSENNDDIHYDTYRPPVSTSVVPSSDDYLGSHVLNCTAESIRRVFIEDRLFAQAKISDFDISSLIQQDVLRLQISVHNA